MVNIRSLRTEYITDKEGNKKSVILSISDFQELLEDMEDMAILAERRNEPNIAHEEVLKELREDGLI